ncbi:hypothetical protein M885DRAFT_618152, partial [Pelagophyceae sp. CCMP2097]
MRGTRKSTGHHDAVLVERNGRAPAACGDRGGARRKGHGVQAEDLGARQGRLVIFTADDEDPASVDQAACRPRRRDRAGPRAAALRRRRAGRRIARKRRPPALRRRPRVPRARPFAAAGRRGRDGALRGDARRRRRPRRAPAARDAARRGEGRPRGAMDHRRLGPRHRRRLGRKLALLRARPHEHALRRTPVVVGGP